MEGLVSVFSGKVEAKEGIREEELEKLHAKIGQLVVERDFLPKSPVDEHRAATGADRSWHGQPSAVRQCELVSISRSPFYHRPTVVRHYGRGPEARRNDTIRVEICCHERDAD